MFRVKKTKKCRGVNFETPNLEVGFFRESNQRKIHIYQYYFDSIRKHYISTYLEPKLLSHFPPEYQVDKEEN